MNDLPNRPLNRIIRARDTASWIDGYAFLEQAKTEAKAIRAAADDEVSKARNAGREEGRKAGEAEVAALLMRTHADIDRYLASVEPLVALLAMDIVQRIIGTIGDAELVSRAACKSLDVLREEHAVVINVAPDLVSDVQERITAFDPASRIRVTADRHLSGTQCIVTTPLTSIDVGIEIQLDAIRSAMNELTRSGL